MIRKFLEKRVAAVLETRSYSDLVVSGLLSQASGTTGNALQTGALAIASSIWSRTLAAAEVEGTDTLTPEVLALIGRGLIRDGEALFLIEVVDGAVVLMPVCDFEVLPDWRYRVEVPVPGGKVRSMTVQPAQVLHPKWSVSPREPWRGIGPLADAPLLAKIAGRVEAKVGEDLNTPVAHVLPVPADGGDGGSNDPLAMLKADIAEASGGAILAETTSAGWGDGRQHAPQSDWRSRRLGPEIPDSLLETWRETLAVVLAACGIPPAIGGAGTDASGGVRVREDYRRFVMSAVEPVAATIATEASRKLDTEVTLDFRSLWAHDVVGRASAMKRMVDAGVSLEEAVQLSGLLV